MKEGVSREVRRRKSSDKVTKVVKQGGIAWEGKLYL